MLGELKPETERMEGSRVDAVTFAVLQDKLLREKIAHFPIASGSMEPLIRTGDFIRVEPLTSPPRRFDIIVFWNGRNLICHYIRHPNFLPGADGRDVVITRGLASRGDDQPVPTHHVLGKVVSHDLSPWTRLRISLASRFRRDS